MLVSDLLRLASLMDVDVTFGHLVGRKGVYYNDLRLIIIEDRLTDEETVVTMAHELGHATFGHVASTELTESVADEFAATLLVSQSDYERAERLSTSPHFIAQELGLPSRIVEAYHRVRLKIGRPGLAIAE